MDSEKLNTMLYEKMFEEQEKYRGWLLGQPPEEILNHTYEYTVREDILMSLENSDLTGEQAYALLKSHSPLSDVFSAFERMETGYMDIVFDCMTGRADEMIKVRQEQLRNTPVYVHPASYAREHNELEVYRASNNANVACKEAIEAAIRRHYSNNCLNPGGFKEVSERFGTERVFYVLANTVRAMDTDGRISRDNKAWAQTIPVEQNPDAFGTDRNCYFVVNSHPGLTDLFLTQARREQREQKQEVEKRPSVLARIQKPAAAKTTAAKKSPKKTEPER